MTSGGSTLTYAYNEKDQLLTISDGSEILTRYTYDLSGNRISESNGTAATTYTYDEANQLTGVTKNGASIGAYTYDARGQRRSSGATAYLYDDLTLLAKTDSAGTEYFYYDADEEIIQKVAGNNTYDYVTDVRGSVAALYDAGGIVASQITYDAYGNTTVADNAQTNAVLAYTGAVMDEATGLYYMNARYYDPAIGAFISQDSYRGSGEEFWNLYAYANGDPVNYIDPSGHEAVAISIVAVVGIVMTVIGGADYLIRRNKSLMIR